MRYSIIFSVFILITSCSGCSSKASITDTDIFTEDKDSASMLDATVDTQGEGESDESAEETIADADTNNDNDVDAVTPDCPSLKAAKFPYYDKDGIITFCRKCDLPASTDDPQCVRNLWSEANKKLTKDYPEQDCTPYPCTLDKLKPNNTWVQDAECDYDVSAYSSALFSGMYYDDEAETLAMILITNVPGDDGFKHPFERKLVSYDASNSKYTAIMPIRPDFMGFSGGVFYGMTADYNNVVDGDSYKNANNYLVSYNPQSGYRVVYNKPIYGFYDRLYLNDKWAYMAILENKEDQGSKRMYAKIGEWQWHEIDAEYSGFASFGGDIMALSGNDSDSVYLCDMNKYPKTKDDCIMLNKDGERIFTAKMDKSIPNRFVYPKIDSESGGRFILGDITDKGIVTNEYPFSFTEANPYVTYPDQLQGDLMTYVEMFLNAELGGSQDAKVCFYRFSEKKSYCPSVKTNSKYDMTMSYFEGKNLFFRGYQRHAVSARDMECYCKKYPDSCPFPEYKPTIFQKAKKLLKSLL